jgi:hypothetical protein
MLSGNVLSEGPAIGDVRSQLLLTVAGAAGVAASAQRAA